MLHHSVEASLVALAVAVALIDTCQHYLRQPSVDVANFSVNLLVSVTGGLLDSHLPARAPERYTVYRIVSFWRHPLTFPCHGNHPCSHSRKGTRGQC